MKNDYRKYINALRKCAKEHEKDFTGTGCIRVSDLCNDTADLLESLEKKENYLEKLADMQTQIKELVPDSLKESEKRRMKYIIITTYGQRIIEAEDFEAAVQEAYNNHTQYREVQAIIQLDEDIDLIEREDE